MTLTTAQWEIISNLRLLKSMNLELNKQLFTEYKGDGFPRQQTHKGMLKTTGKGVLLRALKA